MAEGGHRKPRKVSCKTRDMSVLGLCGATPSEISDALGVSQCPPEQGAQAIRKRWSKHACQGQPRPSICDHRFISRLNASIDVAGQLDAPDRALLDRFTVELQPRNEEPIDGVIPLGPCVVHVSGGSGGPSFPVDIRGSRPSSGGARKGHVLHTVCVVLHDVAKVAVRGGCCSLGLGDRGGDRQSPAADLACDGRQCEHWVTEFFGGVMTSSRMWYARL